MDGFIGNILQPVTYKSEKVLNESIETKIVCYKKLKMVSLLLRIRLRVANKPIQQTGNGPADFSRRPIGLQLSSKRHGRFFQDSRAL